MGSPPGQAGLIEAGAGRPLVFLHGWTMAGDVFADALARLSGRFHCLAPDLPGHGAARGAPQGAARGIDASAEALDRLLSARGLSGALLVGWSMGATVAWRYLDRFGAARVAGMASLDMSPRILGAPGWRLGLRGYRPDTVAAKLDLFRNRWPQAAAMIAEGLYGSAGTCDLLPRTGAEARIAAQDGATMADIWHALTRADLRDAVRRLPVPLLVVHGAQSRLYGPQTAHWLERQAPRATRVEFSLSGHAPHLEEPARFAATIAGFAATLPG